MLTFDSPQYHRSKSYVNAVNFVLKNPPARVRTKPTRTSDAPPQYTGSLNGLAAVVHSDAPWLENEQGVELADLGAPSRARTAEAPMPEPPASCSSTVSPAQVLDTFFGEQAAGSSTGHMAAPGRSDVEREGDEEKLPPELAMPPELANSESADLSSLCEPTWEVPPAELLLAPHDSFGPRFNQISC